MKRTTRLLSLLLAVVLCLSALPLGAAAAGDTGWRQQEDGEWYYLKNGERAGGWLKSGGSWYFLQYTMVHDCFLQIDNVQYYFLSDGRMATGWQQVSTQNPDGHINYPSWKPHTYWSYFYSSGKQISDGWQKIGGKWYYFCYGEMMTGLFNTDPGFLKTGSATGKWYWLGQSGAMQTGWKKLTEIYRGGAFETVKPYWTYFYSSGEQVSPGWRTIDGTQYLFDEYGRMVEDVRGWKQENGAWYYYLDDGTRLTGWFNSDPDYLVTGSENGSWYYFDDDGRMHTGWKRFQGSFTDDAGNVQYYDYWAYFQSSGVQVENAWQKVGGVWYCFDEIGAMYSDGVYQIGGDWYCFSASGAMQTGWKQIPFVTENGMIRYGWAYFTSSGAMKMNGWEYDGKNWYYFENGSYIAGGMYYVGGYYYFFKDSGAMLTGWKKIDGNWCYFKSSGRMMMTGTLQIDGTDYAFIEGVMVTNRWFNQRYYGSSGAMLKNTSRTINGTYYTFDERGVPSPYYINPNDQYGTYGYLLF